ncbi:MAG: DUF211 domain-containing protein [Candidatus Diapherotrites archaeon]|nr:DUF211 domain-containing protein [Candidatus Diapherotrites archaeon]
MNIKKIVIDVLKPHEPNIIEYSKALSELNGVDGVTIRSVEIDEKTESIEMSLEGGNIDFEEVKKVVESLGGSIHSVDLVSAGVKIVEPDNINEG